MKSIRWAAIASAAMLTATPSLWAQLTKVDIFPPNAPPGTAGTYTPGGGGVFTITSDGRGFFPNMTFTTDTNNPVDINDTGDGLTFAYETVTGDFDKRVKITSISADAGNQCDPWTRGALMARTATNHYAISFQLVAANPDVSCGAPAGANQVGFTGRALDGQNYTWWSRNLSGVNNALPNQWLRLRRVGNQFTAYVGTNGTTWTLIGQRYQTAPATLIVGPYAASGSAGTIATVNFASYGNTPSTDAIAPVLLSAGTLDKAVVGVRFSEPVASATATVLANYQITQTGGGAVTINSVKMGISGDAVHLAVSGLTNDNFTVKVIGSVTDTTGNLITPNTQVAAKALNWNHADIGLIQDINNRPKPGDDPGTVGQAVLISSDENPEMEIIGGGSNQWDPGDFIHYVWRTEPLSGNFDVTLGISRYDRPANTAGWGNAGIMLRAATYRPGLEYTVAGTKVQHVVNSTYIEASSPGRGSIPLWRTANGGGYGNGNAGFGWPTLIGGVKGYYSELRGINASGDIDPLSAPDTARYLRIKRVGTEYTFYASWNRTDWALVHGPQNLPTLPDQLLLGISVMGDTGGAAAPYSGYGGSGHQIDPMDPYNPLNTGRTNAIGEPAIGWVQNDSHYEVMRIKIFPNGVTDPLPAALTKVDIRPADEPVSPPNALPGSWTSTGTLSFNMTGGGTGPFRNLSAPYDGTIGGDQLTFAYETVTGDFDKQVSITSLTNRIYNNDGSAFDYSTEVPVDTWARAGLMVRSGTNAYDQCLKIMAANPAGANEVRVMGRGIDAQNYTMFSRSYPGVTNALPNQYLRMKRVGNSFSFFVSKNGVSWSKVGQCYQEFPSTVCFGPYCAAGLNPADLGGNPNGFLSLAQATFAAYDDVANYPTGDLAGPVLISAGTIDKKTVGVKFNEQVGSASATAIGNYTLSQGTVTAAKVGIGGDTVYLTVNGLTNNTFTVTVSNVRDTLGNIMTANSVVNAKVTALVSADIGNIQNPSPRTPTPGDDPYRIGQAVATSSDEAAEVEIIGGGSNAWNPGDYLHWLYNPTPIAGDFDVAVKVSRNDRPNNTAGWANSGVMLRQSVYVAGMEYTPAGTKVPMVANTTYIENSAPARAAIPLWRAEEGANYGNGTPVGWTTLVGGIKGYFGDLRATDASGTLDPESSAYSARWLRIQKAGAEYRFSWSYNGLQWEVESTHTPGFTNSTFMFGFSTMGDTGGGTPPFSGYGGNGHTLDALDPLNYLNAGGNVLNEANYAVQKVRLYSSSAAIGSISAAKSGSQVSITFAGTLVSSTSLNGPWTVVPRQSSPYLVTPNAANGGGLYFRVIP